MALKDPKKLLPLNKLLAKAQRIFNAWIRKRDEGKPCINCGKFRTLQAGHYYPTSTHSHLRFHEHNVNGECLKCNYYNSQSHAFGYKVNLERKIGKKAFDTLVIAASTKRAPVRMDRFYLEEIIAKYK